MYLKKCGHLQQDLNSDLIERKIKLKNIIVMNKGKVTF